MAHEPKIGRKPGAHASGHYPVMAKEVVAALDVRDGEVVLDATYGAGGHSALLTKAASITLVALDADPSVGSSLPRARSGRIPYTANFGDLKEVAQELGIDTIDKAVFDLGWNRGQLVSGRGFSFMHNEPLIMSYGERPRSGFTAAQMLNTFSEKVLADIIFGYGEERYARRIAKAIVARRAAQPFSGTLELVEVINDAVPPRYRRGKIHPATRTFQALRIAVNDELGALAAGLAAAWDLLACDGRIAVITFHSIEDRLVKRFFAARAKGGGVLLYKKPHVPSQREIKENPASRSAKLRVIKKLCQNT